MFSVCASLPRALNNAKLGRTFTRRSLPSSPCDRTRRVSLKIRSCTYDRHLPSASGRGCTRKYQGAVGPSPTGLLPSLSTVPATLPCSAVGGFPVAARRLKATQIRQAMGSLSKAATGLQSLNVAVIGAGASGLVAARELREEGHQVTVLEASQILGGIWAYDEQIESDVLGTDAARKPVHSSMYASLRTNLPREVMSYLDLPFIPEAMGGRSVDPRRFCSHEEVMAYLLAYADRYSLHDMIQYGCTVSRASPVWSPGTPHSSADCLGWEVAHKGEHCCVSISGNARHCPRHG